MTHKQLSNISGSRVQCEILRSLLWLLISIGWKAEPRQIEALLKEELRESIDEIVGFVAKTSKMIREEYVSDDLEVTYIPSGQQFNPSLMDGQASGPDVFVLGTVELGLALRNRAGGQCILLKPSVVLDTHTLS